MLGRNSASNPLYRTVDELLMACVGLPGAPATRAVVFDKNCDVVYPSFALLRYAEEDQAIPSIGLLSSEGAHAPFWVSAPLLLHGERLERLLYFHVISPPHGFGEGCASQPQSWLRNEPIANTPCQFSVTWGSSGLSTPMKEGCKLILGVINVLTDRPY